MLWRRQCAQMKMRRPVKAFRREGRHETRRKCHRAPLHHHRRGSDMHSLKVQLLEWAVKDIRARVGCARTSMRRECVLHARKDLILLVLSRFGCVRLELMDGNAIASICTKCCRAVVRGQHFCAFHARAETLFYLHESSLLL